MKKKKLTERLNRYFSAEENAIRIPPIETIHAYNEFSAGYETPTNRAEQARRPARRIRRVGRSALLAACLAVLLAVAVAIPAFVSRPENRPGDSIESNGGANGGSADKAPGSSQTIVTSDSQGEMMDNPPESVAVTDPGTQQEPDENGNGTGDGGGEVFERYFLDKFYNLADLSFIVTWEEIYAAENKLFAESEYFLHDQLPPLYMMIHELNIQKEDFVRVTGGEFTDEEIDWLFTDADVQTIQKAFKLDTALLYNGKLYNLYELLRLEDPLLRELAGTEEMNAYLADLNTCLEDLERDPSFRWEWERLSDLANQLKAKLEELSWNEGLR